MAQNGYIAARIYTSRGSLPIEGAVITVLENIGSTKAIVGKRVTDRNGQIPLITVSTPNENLSQTPGNGNVFTLVDVRVDKPLFYTVLIKNVQVFAEQTTVIDTPLIPAIENEPYSNKAEEFTETPQNL